MCDIVARWPSPPAGVGRAEGARGEEDHRYNGVNRERIGPSGTLAVGLNGAHRLSCGVAGGGVAAKSLPTHTLAVRHRWRTRSRNDGPAPAPSGQQNGPGPTSESVRGDPTCEDIMGYYPNLACTTGHPRCQPTY